MKTALSRFTMTLVLIVTSMIPVMVNGQSNSNYTVCQGSTEPYWIQTPATGSTYAWTITPGTSGVNWTISVNNNSDIQVHWLLPGAYVVQVIETAANTCIGDPIQLTVTVIALPTVATAGPNQPNLCGVLSTTLAGNTPTVGNGTWSQISGPGTVTFAIASDPVTTATATLYGVYVLRWTIANGICTPSTSDVTITFNQKPVTNGIWHN